ncbi:rRNA maturation RNase YbeY [Halalkalibacter urbisdiaboli]|uniref:rRNA maturation RNase YbeY n=1 Tax=Halalkalibacter urbisdiaboli TaxID=1960589 RepID=UPI000B441320|nr:rRNA maturation RNase YbeY [Halalkalibacter urbisdiaboli]
MNLTVDLVDETDTLSEDHQQLVNQIVEKASQMEGLRGEVELSVTFVDDNRIQEINKEYRDKDQPTDVISFALNEQGEDELDILSDELPNMLGDIIISVPRIHEQAEEYGHSFERELAFLTIHGFLHLLGYDHITEDGEKEMFARQEDILTEYGITR